MQQVGYPDRPRVQPPVQILLTSPHCEDVAQARQILALTDAAAVVNALFDTGIADVAPHRYSLSSKRQGHKKEVEVRDTVKAAKLLQEEAFGWGFSEGGARLVVYMGDHGPQDGCFNQTSILAGSIAEVVNFLELLWVDRTNASAA